MKHISVDFSKPYGKIKPFNAINNGPRERRGWNNLDSYEALHIP